MPLTKKITISELRKLIKEAINEEKNKLEDESLLPSKLSKKERQELKNLWEKEPKVSPKERKRIKELEGKMKNEGCSYKKEQCSSLMMDEACLDEDMDCSSCERSRQTRMRNKEREI